MRAVLQRVAEASVSVDGAVASAIGAGWLVLIGIGSDDTAIDIDYMIDKILNLRVFSDSDGKFNLSAEDIQGEVLVVSQFTLYGDCRKGRRPSFSDAAKADVAALLYQQFVTKLRASTKLKISEGVFQANMQVRLCNDGPVTLMLDSKKEF